MAGCYYYWEPSPLDEEDRSVTGPTKHGGWRRSRGQTAQPHTHGSLAPQVRLSSGLWTLPFVLCLPGPRATGLAGPSSSCGGTPLCTHPPPGISLRLWLLTFGAPRIRLQAQVADLTGSSSQDFSHVLSRQMNLLRRKGGTPPLPAVELALGMVPHAARLVSTCPPALCPLTFSCLLVRVIF